VINIGALVSYFVMAQMATNPTEFGERATKRR
jgi:hypothetical protein